MRLGVEKGKGTAEQKLIEEVRSSGVEGEKRASGGKAARSNTFFPTLSRASPGGAHSLSRTRDSSSSSPCVRAC